MENLETEITHGVIEAEVTAFLLFYSPHIFSHDSTVLATPLSLQISINPYRTDFRQLALNVIDLFNYLMVPHQITNSTVKVNDGARAHSMLTITHSKHSFLETKFLLKWFKYQNPRFSTGFSFL